MWIDVASKGRSNVAPQKLPWDMIRTLITEMYGGKIDDTGDFQQLKALVDKFLTPLAFESDHKLVTGAGDGDYLTLPEETNIRGFTEWVNQLPEREPPSYLGLPENAEKLLLVGHGKKMIADLVKVTTLLDEGEQLMVDD